MVSYIMPRGEGEGRQHVECHQEDSLTLALSVARALWRRGEEGGKWILQGERNGTPTLTFFKFMSSNFTLQEIPCFFLLHIASAASTPCKN